MVCANSHRANVPSEPLQGKALEKPWKSSSRGSNSTANMECSERRWTDEAGQESGAKEGFAGANSPGKTTRNPRGPGCASWDHPPWPHRSRDSGGIKERFGKCHIKENAWKTPHFHPNSPQLPLQPGQTWKAKTETRKRENPRPLRAPGTPWDGSSLEQPLPPGENGTGIKVRDGVVPFSALGPLEFPALPSTWDWDWEWDWIDWY